MGASVPLVQECHGSVKVKFNGGGTRVSAPQSLARAGWTVVSTQL